MKRNHLIDLIVLAFICIFLLSFFKPALLFSLSTATGGDTGSHYPTAVYLKEVLIPSGKIMGWDQGNYAGFPLFYHYFPLTFIITVLFSYIIPMQIAFKLTTVLGIFLLPVCAYFAFRFLRYSFPIPIAAAVFTLPFLFMEANSMWGGNIPSTLAGEYSYALSLALSLLFFGSIYDGVRQKNKIIFNALLIFLIGLSHGYSLIFTGVAAIFFLFEKGTFWINLKYLFKVFGLGLLLLSFWLIPFLASVPYVTSYVVRWRIDSMLNVIPLVLMPFVLLSVAAFSLNLPDRKVLYFGYAVGACTLLYLLSPAIGMLDIRWVPFAQLFLVVFAAVRLNIFLDDIKVPRMVPFIIFLAVILWVIPNTKYVNNWIKWNYEGFEGKASWPLFQEINSYLAKDGEGRVVYEHSPVHNIFGTERAFENLPYFAKRRTLEGLYMQSSISAPFIFYIQSEVSKVHSGPFPQYDYTTLDLPSAIPHLKLFNVTQYIVRSPEAKKMAKTIPELKLEKEFDDYQIYRLVSNDGRYVVPLDKEPVEYKGKNWKKDFFEWFKNYDGSQAFMILGKKDKEPRILVPSSVEEYSQVPISSIITNEEIRFTTNLLHRPHLIKISYHPNWKVEGADKIYLASPSFMLVYPTQKNVRLYFGKTIFNYAGEALSFLGLTILLGSGIIYLAHARKN